MSSDWIATIILAAGKSSRFGENKLLSEFKGKKIIEFTLSLYITNKKLFKDIFVVIGYQHEKILSQLSNYSITTCFNENYITGGMSSSIKVGMQSLLKKDLKKCIGVIIHPADIPFIDLETINRISEKVLQDKTISILIPKYEKKSGHPIFISKFLFHELLNVNEEKKGLRGFIQEYSKLVTYFDVESKFVLVDIDLKADLEKFRD